MLPSQPCATADDADLRPSAPEQPPQRGESDDTSGAKPSDTAIMARSARPLRKVKTWTSRDHTGQAQRPRAGRRPASQDLGRSADPPRGRARQSDSAIAAHDDDSDSPGSWEDEPADAAAPEPVHQRHRVDAALRKKLGATSLAACLTTRANGSGSSSGSGSTITQVSFTKPDALSFLDPDSPAVTEEIIQRSVAEASSWRPSADGGARSSPTARSSSSSESGSFPSDGSEPAAGHETDRSTSPEQSIAGDDNAASPQPKPTISLAKLEEQVAARQHRAYRYGTPEMPRGTANLPHRPARALNPRVASQHPKHLPRAEKLPLTGYELLASRLSSHPSSFGRSRRDSLGAASVRSGRSLEGEQQQHQQERLTPIYRKFEALNHRLLLQLQDELSELEEQLHRLDTADTQTRRMQNGILPASRRAEFLAGGELQWHRTDILGKIGYKLGQYNHVLTSFTEAQRLTSPSPSDVEVYRAYLSNQQPITEIETRFLDMTDDLVSPSYARPRRPPSSPTSSSAGSAAYGPRSSLPDEVLTPIPPAGAFLPRRPQHHRHPHAPPSSPSASSRASSVMTAHRVERGDDAGAGDNGGEVRRDTAREGGELAHLAIATAVAVLVPILTFTVIPGFVGRMAVVLLVALAVFGTQAQAGTVGIDRRDLVVCVGVYGGVMAVLAGVSGVST